MATYHVLVQFISFATNSGQTYLSRYQTWVATAVQGATPRPYGVRKNSRNKSTNTDAVGVGQLPLDRGVRCIQGQRMKNLR